MSLLHQVCDWYRSAVANFDWMREARRAYIRCGLQPTSNKAAGQNPHSPSGWGGAGAPPSRTAFVFVLFARFILFP
jgi:hypothetical protein